MPQFSAPPLRYCFCTSGQGESNETLGGLGLEKHPDKTFIGRVERGLDLLGYRLGRGRPLSLASTALERHRRKMRCLQEQERAGRVPPGALGAYRLRFEGWARAGLPARNGLITPPRRPMNTLAGGTFTRGITRYGGMGYTWEVPAHWYLKRT
jgi:hypothetical protein